MRCRRINDSKLCTPDVFLYQQLYGRSCLVTRLAVAVRLFNNQTMSAAAPLLSPAMTPTHRSVYLLVFRSPIFPAHWALWIPRQDSAHIGKLINTVGDPATGFAHEFQRNFRPASYASGATLLVLLDNNVRAEHIVDGDVRDESTIDADAVDGVENVALKVPPPGKSLNSVARVRHAGHFGQTDVRNACRISLDGAWRSRTARRG
jgi:hypothetical protein